MLPAYAGMILAQKGKGMAAFSAPRVCGDDPAAPEKPSRTPACSPRMRG